MTDVWDKSKSVQMELLMERIRVKGGSNWKPLGESVKAVKMAILERKVIMDAVAKNLHQKSLDLLQKSIKVTTLQSLIERLECLTRQLGLKFMLGPSGEDIFISSEMFYFEISLESSGKVKDVIIHHEGRSDTHSCQELINCLSQGDFDDFTLQLEQFSSIYQLNAEKQVKSKAFSALQSLESDLNTLYQLQNHIKDCYQLIHQSPIGLLEKRKGGHPLKLFYFVSPYDLINKDTKSFYELTTENVIQKKFGSYVHVSVEGSSSNQLQTATIVFINQNLNNKSSPSYAALNGQNSVVLPACFVLKLNKNIPITTMILRQIEEITEVKQFDYSSSKPLMDVIIANYSHNQCGKNKLFVTLTDQSHCYYLTETKGMDGIIIDKIQFTHPSQIVQLIGLLRQQVLFNVIVSSCIRINAVPNFEKLMIFEINALSWQHLTISMEHPFDDSLVNVELDLSDFTNLQCKIKTSNRNSNLSNEHVNDVALKTFQKSLSIPMTLRSIWRFWNDQIEKTKYPQLLNGNNNNNGAQLDPNSNGNINTIFNELNSFNDAATDSKGKFDSTDCHQMYYDGSNDIRKKESTTTEPVWSVSKTVYTSDGVPNLVDESDANLDNSSDSMTTSLPSQPEIDLSGFDLNDLNMKDVYDEYDELNDDSDGSEDGGDNDDGGKIKTRPNDHVLDLMNSSISITPITVSTMSPNHIFSQSVDKRSSVEIIPLSLAQSQPPSLSSKVTITPLRIKDKKTVRSTGSKSSTYCSDADKSKNEKKRKRRRDDNSSMGPPTKQIRSVSPSVKPGPGPGQASPIIFKQFMKNLEHTSITPTSPKNNSPKPQATSSIGKPSISALKSAANSPSHKTFENIIYKPKSTSTLTLTSTSTSTSKDKEKKSITNTSSSITLVKQKVSPSLVPHATSSASRTSPKIDYLALENQMQQQQQLIGSSSSSSASESRSSPTKQAQKNRKNTLSDVIDKLKLVQNTETPEPIHTTKSNLTIRNLNAMSSSTTSSPNFSKNSETKKSSEYMIKPSSDGMKITINKTKSKDSKTKVSNKSLTKLVSSSTPVSNFSNMVTIKRQTTPQTVMTKVQTSLPSTTKTSSKMQYNIGGSSSISGGSCSSSSSTSSSLSNKNIPIGYNQKTSPSLPLATSKSLEVRNKRLTKSNSDKSIFNSLNRKDDFGTDGAKLATNPVSIMLTDSIQKMNFPKNFHIPKLSARNNRDDLETKKAAATTTSGIGKLASSSANSSQLFDLIKQSSNSKCTQDKKDNADCCNDVAVTTNQNKSATNSSSNVEELLVRNSSKSFSSTDTSTVSNSISLADDVVDLI